MQENEALLIMFLATLGLFILLVALVVVPLITYNRRGLADQILIKQLEDKYEKELLKSRIEVQDQTLQHYSRELHDNIGSGISIAKAYNKSELPEGERTEIVDDLLKKVLDEIRLLSKGQSLDAIKTNGLTTAIDGFVDQIKKIGQYVVTYGVVGNYILLEEQTEIIAFRILQESVNNIIRHADATKIDIYMICKPESMCLRIQDDGKGFDMFMSVKPGGLSNMRTRAALIDATLKIEQPITGGTKISLCIPLTSISKK